MALTHPLLGLAVLVILMAAGVAGWSWHTRRNSDDAELLLADANRIRSLPRFQVLARRRRRWLVVEACAVVMAACGIALLAARPMDAATAQAARSNRDIVLCLDVSGSMRPVVSDVMESFEELGSDLAGERISLVFFDSTAVTMFPLTDDAAYITEQLSRMRDGLESRTVPGTQVGEVGTSLIGDGLASCLQRFDRDDRSRTVVLATDNQTAGRPLHLLPEAMALARDAEVLVFAITPSDNTVGPTLELEDQVAATGGELLLLRPEAPLDTITRAIAATQARELDGPTRRAAGDLVWPGITIVAAGALIAQVARRTGMRS